MLTVISWCVIASGWVFLAAFLITQVCKLASRRSRRPVRLTSR